MARITVEDCLEQQPNRFALCKLVALRAKQLEAGSPAKLADKRKSNKAVVSALREVAEGKVRFMTAEEETVAAAEEERIKEEAARNRKAAADAEIFKESNGTNGDSSPSASETIDLESVFKEDVGLFEDDEEGEEVVAEGSDDDDDEDDDAEEASIDDDDSDGGEF